MHNESLARRRIASMHSLCPRAFATAKHLFIIGWTNGYVKLGLVCGAAHTRWCGVPRLRRGQGHFDCPCNLRVPLRGILCAQAAHSRLGCRVPPCGAGKGFPLALATFGCRLRRRRVRCEGSPLTYRKVVRRCGADRQACPPASDPSHHPPCCTLATGENLLPLLFRYSFVAAIIMVTGASLFYGNGYDGVMM